ncbi:hypothetical protein [Candidatus Anaplasma sp. TIGMIC]|uniref:hypothetical protein n=1 Tax=Candidatus Anaplasma sp. TIGMIC TaxID=3020713 RepID=UPI00232AA1D3|nr:hypothetical protein [Candidatus Anaplasma sp. TIGMIC]MDB1135403.1 hypothetical protein [Candidatus Anaplasma sp. TIGMIC]
MRGEGMTSDDIESCSVSGIDRQEPKESTAPTSRCTMTVYSFPRCSKRSFDHIVVIHEGKTCRSKRSSGADLQYVGGNQQAEGSKKTHTRQPDRHNDLGTFNSTIEHDTKLATQGAGAKRRRTPCKVVPDMCARAVTRTNVCPISNIMAEKQHDHTIAESSSSKPRFDTVDLLQKLKKPFKKLQKNRHSVAK